jgi:hypothetical protein
MKLTGCAHRRVTSLDQFSELPPDLAASYSDSTVSKRCARESPRNSTRPVLDANSYLLGLAWFRLTAPCPGLGFHDGSLP